MKHSVYLFVEEEEQKIDFEQTMMIDMGQRTSSCMPATEMAAESASFKKVEMEGSFPERWRGKFHILDEKHLLVDEVACQRSSCLVRRSASRTMGPWTSRR